MDPIWWGIKWNLHYPSKANLELQLNYREIIQYNQLKTSWREAL